MGAQPGDAGRAGEKGFLGSHAIASQHIIPHLWPKRAYRKVMGRLPEAYGTLKGSLRDGYRTVTGLQDYEMREGG
jgi:hypothetical protein